MKNCYVCKNELPEEYFNKNKAKPSGLADECKNCKAVKDKAYREANKEKCKAKAHRYYLEHAEEIRKKTGQYAKDNRESHNVRCTKAKNKLKAEVLRRYCGDELKCKECPEKDLGVLTIDHINGDGAEHRREIGLGRKCGYNFYRWLKNNGYPDGFQVLCFNCNFRKRAVELKPENPTHLQLVRAKYARSIKVECLEVYGGCECPCGEVDLDVLTLDHVNDDGAEHRRETGTRGNNFYHMLRKNEFPKEPSLQVLCLNCQFRKRCKHGKRKQS
jgi:hypothetical protein